MAALIEQATRSPIQESIWRAIIPPSTVEEYEREIARIIAGPGRAERNVRSLYECANGIFGDRRPTNNVDATRSRAMAIAVIVGTLKWLRPRPPGGWVRLLSDAMCLCPGHLANLACRGRKLLGTYGADPIGVETLRSSK